MTTEKNIVIIGAGMAGLASALGLEQRGYACTVLEADVNHIGGRVRTVTLGHYNGNAITGEVGAMRIPCAHNNILDYVRKLGLTTRPFVDGPQSGYAHFFNQRSRRDDLSQIVRTLRKNRAEFDADASELWRRIMRGALHKISQHDRLDLYAPAPDAETVCRLDSQSLVELLLEAKLSEDEMDFLNTQYELEPLLNSASTEHVREFIDHAWDSGFVEIVGGMDKLTQAMASRLSAPVHKDCQVVAIHQSENGDRARVSFLNRGKLCEVSADYVVCTVPCPIMASIEFDTPLDHRKQRAFRQVHYESGHKVLALTSSRFWETDDGFFGGASCTDLPSGMTIYPSDNPDQDPDISRQPAAMLASYTCGAAARRLGSMPDAVLETVIKRCLTKLHPQSIKPGAILKLIRWHWDAHPWAGGAFAMYAPGQHQRLHADLIRPAGRVHFAGEHTSLQHSWLQGALTSAHRVIDEITTDPDNYPKINTEHFVPIQNSETEVSAAQ